MLDGRKSILWAAPFVLAMTACGGETHVGATVAEDPPNDEVTPVDEPVNAATPVDTPELDENPADPVVMTRCDNEDAPARCDANPQTFEDYGAAGVITMLEVLEDASCCVDFDGDGTSDNALGQGFADIQKLDELNQDLAQSLVDGAQTIVFELLPPSAGQNDQTVTLNVYGGHRVGESPTYGPQIAIDAATIDRGVAPLFTFDDARVEGDRLTASQGAMQFEASFNGVLLKPTVHDVRLDARIEGSDSGLTLRDGAIGGRIELSQIHSEISRVAADCDCLALRQPLVTDGVCSTPDVAACEAAGAESCAAIAEVCPVLEIIASNIADVDADGDGTPDSISLGAIFETEPAEIAGVMQ